MLTGLKSTCRRHGVLRTVPYAFTRVLKRLTVFDIAHLMVADAAKAKRAEEKHPGLECRFLTANQVCQFAQDPTNDMTPEIADRLESDHDHCFAGIVDGKLASYCWLAQHSIESKHNRGSHWANAGVSISYPQEYCFRYKGFTHPDFRGQRLYQKVSSEASLAMQEMGVPYILSTAEWVNYSALKSSYRSGYEYLGILAVIVVAGRRFVSTPSSLGEKGIYFGEDADVIDRDLISLVKLSDASPDSTREAQTPAATEEVILRA